MYTLSFSPIAYDELYAPSLLMELPENSCRFYVFEAKNRKCQCAGMILHRSLCSLFQDEIKLHFLGENCCKRVLSQFLLLRKAQQWLDSSCWTQSDSSRRDRILNSASLCIK